MGLLNAGAMAGSGDSAADRSFSQRRPSPVANQPTIVAGSRMIELAKIGGITPLMLSFSGRWLL